MHFLKKYSQHITFLFIAAYILVTFFMMFNFYKPSHAWTDENFNLRVNNTFYENINVNEFSLPHIKKGDHIMLECKLNKLDKSHKYLVFKTYSSTVNVFLNGNRVYSYGNDLYKNKKLLGRGYHIVALKNDDSIHPTVVIKLHSSENLNYKWLDFVKFTGSNSVWSNILEYNLNSVAISIVLFMVGLIGFISCFIVFWLLNVETGHLLYSFATAFFIGLWNMCTNGLFQKLTGNMELVALFEYMSLYITPFFYINIISIIKGKHKFSLFFNIAKIFYIIFVVSTVILHLMHICPISHFITIFRSLSIVSLAVVLFLILNHYDTQKPYERVLSIGTLISAGIIITESSLLNVNIHVITFFKKDYEISDLFTSVAILIMVTTPLISYSINSGEVRKYENQISLLKNIAYKDNLTGLYNRYKGMAKIIKLRKNNIPYHLILFDLNNLKVTNDNFGHERGDKLLIDFSNCLKYTFSDEDCTCIRQGGDEFLIILKDVSVVNIHNYIKRLYRNINKTNKLNNDPCDISFAYGIAGSNEVEGGDYDSTFKLADKRMYLNKTEMKENGQEDIR